MNSEIKVSENKFELTILGAFCMVILYYFIIMQCVAFPFCFLSDCVSSHKTLKLIADGLIEFIPEIIIVILLLKKIREDYKKDFKISYIKRFDFKLLVCTIFSMVGLYLCIQSSIGPVLGSLPVPKFIEEGFKDLTSNVFFGVISITIFGPIVEEIIMRGIILEGLLNKNKPVISIIVSAVLFGLIHMNLPQGINATMLGILLGYIYYKTRSLALSIICHMVNNIICIFRVNSSIITLLIGIAIIVTAIVFFERFLKKMKIEDGNLKKDIA